MQTLQLENLENRLLDGGVRPRHVRRTIAELRDHYEEALRDERAKGLSGADAEQAAWIRIGNEEDIVNNALSRPELRSLATRYPRIIFGAGPVVLWIALLVLATMLSVSAFEAGGRIGWLPPQGAVLDSSVSIFMNAGVLRVLPVILEAAIMWMAIRQRLTSACVFVGAALVAILAGTTSFTLIFSPVVTQPNEFQITSYLIPVFTTPFTDAVGPLRVADLTEGLGRSIIMFALMLVPFIIWRHRQKSQIVAKGRSGP